MKPRERLGQEAPPVDRVNSGGTTASPVSAVTCETHDGIAAALPTEGTERLSAEQLQMLLDALKERSKQSSPFGAKVTPEEAKRILENDPGLALSLFNGMRWGAQWELVKEANLPADAYDLSSELDIPKQLASLRAIPKQIRDTAIQELRKEYSNIPENAFDRWDDQRGPSAWEWLLLCKVSGPGMGSMSEQDYRAAQKKLPREQRLDQEGISWLEATPEQLARGDAPGGVRGVGVVCVGERDADRRDDFRGGRARAKGSVA